MVSKPHSIEDEAIATDGVDMGTLLTDNRSLQEENKSLHDRLLRALAEAENVRRQADRTNADARQYAISEFARELLNVVDNLERTIEIARSWSSLNENLNALLEGVHATLRSFIQTLERFAVRPIDAQGKTFDPNFHEAVMEIENPSVPPGTVTEVLQRGYTIHNRLLRPARVVVSKQPEIKPAQGPIEPEDNDPNVSWRPRSIAP